MIAILSNWRAMCWQGALILLFGLFVIACMLGVYLCARFGRDDHGMYIEPKDLDPSYRTNRFSVGRDVKERQ